MTEANRLSHLFKYNKEAVNKFSSVRSKEDALAVVKNYISDYTEEELLRNVEDMQSSVITEGALDVDQLDSVVGGTSINWGVVGRTLPKITYSGENFFDSFKRNNQQ